MTEFLIKLVGIVMLVTTPMADAPNSKHVIVPMEQTDHPGNHAHVPFIAFTTETCGKHVSCAETGDWGTPTTFPCNSEQWAYLRLDGLRLAFNLKSPPLTIEPSYTQQVPRIRDYCPAFQIDEVFLDHLTADARKAATFDIDRGTLQARGDVLKDQSVEAWWRVETDGQLVVTATSLANPADERILTLQPGTKIKIGNQLKSMLECQPTAPTTDNHFLVYSAALKKETDPTTCLARPGSHTRLKDRDPHATCSITDYP
jgi:hypothetical protein